MASSSEKFTFTWKIENSFCITSSAGRTTSPYFKVHILGDTEWQVQLVCKEVTDDKIYALLRRSASCSGPETIQIDYGIYMIAPDGSLCLEDHRNDVKFSKGNNFLPISVFHLKDIEEKCTNDSLTLQCILWKSKAENYFDNAKKVAINDSVQEMHKEICKELDVESEVSCTYPNRCFAVTRFKVERRSQIYHLNHFTKLKEDYSVSIPFTSTAIKAPSFLVTLHMIEESTGVDIYLSGLEEEIEAFCLVNFKSMLLSSNHEKLCIADKSHTYVPNESYVWKVASFEKCLVVEKGSLYLQNDVLSLEFDLTIYKGQKNSEISEIGFQDLSQKHKNTTTLADELYKFFREQSFCDLTLQARNGTLEAHKLVVCAKSPTIRAIFEDEKTKNTTKTIRVPDLDITTLRRMVEFMYSEKFEDTLNDQGAIKLYHAADKYKYDKLGKECSIFLMSNLSIINVCSVLELSNIYRDKNLKVASHVYIKSNLNEILRSDEWTNFINKNVILASETIRYISTNILER